MGSLDERESVCEIPQLGNHCRCRTSAVLAEPIEFVFDSAQPELALIIVI